MNQKPLGNFHLIWAVFKPIASATVSGRILSPYPFIFAGNLCDNFVGNQVHLVVLFLQINFLPVAPCHFSFSSSPSSKAFSFPSAHETVLDPTQTI